MRIRALRTSVAAGLVVMTSAAGVTAAVHASAPAPCGGNTAYAGNGWQAIKVPQVSTIALAASVTYAPDRLYVSDGHSTLLRSDNGGCNWEEKNYIEYLDAIRGHLTAEQNFTSGQITKICWSLDEIIACGRELEKQGESRRNATEAVDYLVARVVDWCRIHPRRNNDA